MKSKRIIRTISVLIVIVLSLLLISCGNDNPNSNVPKPTENKDVEDIVKNTSLKFEYDGKFKIVIFSDLKESLEVSEEVIDYMNKILDKEKPGLVILGGNICDDLITEVDSLKSFLDILAEPMESRNISWCHVYGTDAYEMYKQIPKAAQNEIYESYKNCISGEEYDYVLPILRNDSDKIAYNVWLMDTHSYLNDYVEGLEDQVLLSRALASGKNYDTLRFSQVKWYWETSAALEKHNGEAIPGVMYFHMPLHEFNYIYRNADATKMQGTKVENVSAPELNSGILWTCYEKGDIRAIFCGHDRSNDFSGYYMDMLLGYTSTIGRNSNESTRGARVVQLDLNAEKNLSTWMLYVSDLNE